MSDSPNIPLYRSEFLQDFTIHFGVHVKAKEPGWRLFFQATVDVIEHEGRSLERLAIWIKTFTFTRTNFILWEDKTVWVSVDSLAADNYTSEFQVGFYPDFELLNFSGTLEALDATVSISTRLCYNESPERLLRQIWKYQGKAEITGTLG